MADVVEEFDKLSQEGSVIECQMQFEELRALLWTSQSSLTKPYFVSNFISGLKDELRPMVKMMMPIMMKQVAEKAKLQELTLEAIFKKHGMPPSNNPPTSQQVEGNPEVNSNLNTVKNPMPEQRQLGLCYKCGDNFRPDHQYRRLLLNMERLDKKEEEEVVFHEETGECKVIIGKELQKLLQKGA